MMKPPDVARMTTTIRARHGTAAQVHVAEHYHGTARFTASGAAARGGRQRRRPAFMQSHSGSKSQVHARY